MIEFIKEYVVFVKERKKYWLIPLFLVLGIVGLLVIGTSGTALSPFVYSLF